MYYEQMTEKQRVEYWRSQVDFTRKKMAPWFEAAHVIERYFSAEAASEREADLEVDTIGEEHTARIKAGVLYGWLDQVVSNAIDREPIFRARPENKLSAEFQEDVSASINYYWRRTKQLRTDERIFLDASIYPYGAAKLGYTIDFDLRDQKNEQEDLPEFDFPEEENLWLAEGNAALVTEFQDHRYHNQHHEEKLRSVIDPPTDSGALALKDHMDIHDAFEDRMQPNADTAVRNESVWAKRWQPDQFLVDWTAQEGLRDARWIDFDGSSPLLDIQANPNYRNTDDLSGSSKAEGSGQYSEVTLLNNPFEMVDWHEIWVRDFPVAKNKYRNLLLVIADGHDSFLREEDEWPYDRLDDFPAEVLSFHTGIRTWFNKSPLAMGGADSIQMLVNEILDANLYVARKNKNIIMYDSTIIKDQNVVQNMIDAPDSTAHAIPGLADRELSGAPVRAFQFLEVGAEKDRLMNTALAMFDRAMGSPQPNNNTNPDSATEANIIERRNTSRENRRASLLNEFQVRKATKMWQLITQFVPEELELIAPEVIEYASVTPAMARGQYRFQLDVTSQSAALALERSQGMDLVNLLSGLTPLLVQSGFAKPNLGELIRRLLIRGFNEKDIDDIMPMDQEAPASPEVLGPDGQPVPIGAGEEITDPEAIAANEAVTAGQQSGRGIGPADADLFGDTSSPSLGRTSGRSEGV